MKRVNVKKLKKFINQLVKEEYFLYSLKNVITEEIANFNEDMPLGVAKKLSKETPGRQYNDLTTLNGKITTKQDKSVSDYEKKVQPELLRVVNMLKAYLKYIKPNSPDYRTAEDIINNALLTGKIPTNDQQGLISRLAAKHGLREQGVGSGMELTMAANEPTNFNTITHKELSEIINSAIKNEIFRLHVHGLIQEELIAENWKSMLVGMLIGASTLFGANFSPANAQSLSSAQIASNIENIVLAKYKIGNNAIVIYKTIDGKIKILVAVPSISNINLIRTTATTVARKAYRKFSEENSSAPNAIPVMEGSKLSDSKDFIIVAFSVN